MNIIYDGTYERYINALEKALKEKSDYISKEESENLFEENFLINSSKEKAYAFEKEINAVSKEALKKIRLLWFSEKEGFENTALGYLKNIFKYGAQGENNLSDENVYKCDKLAKKVLYEAHRFKGFVRFSQDISGIMFAKISPEHNILPLIKGHFLARFSKISFAIFDEKRKLCLFNLDGLKGIKLAEDIVLKLSESEKEISGLWINFFKTISIKERENTKLQKNKVPFKYRKNLIEFGK